mgnify:CR=1 FL=1
MLQVVLIDDEYFFRNSLKRAIPWGELGFQIIGDANNGRDGYRLICDKHPDIAIIDINMPLITGLELIEMVRREQISCKTAGIRFVGYECERCDAIRCGIKTYAVG